MIRADYREIALPFVEILGFSEMMVFDLGVLDLVAVLDLHLPSSVFEQTELEMRLKRQQ